MADRAGNIARARWGAGSRLVVELVPDGLLSKMAPTECVCGVSET
jgi:hypothetical protein